MGFLSTLGTLAGVLSLLQSTGLFGGRRKSSKIRQDYFRQNEQEIQPFIIDPTKTFLKPFSTIQEQLLFRQQQEDLLNLRLYRPKEKLGG